MRRTIRIKTPFEQLYDLDLSTLADKGLAPEICLHSWDLDRFGEDDFKAASRRLGKYGLRPTMHGPFLDLNPGSGDPVVKAHSRWRMEQVMLAVDIIKPITLVCHAGFDPDQNGHNFGRWMEHAANFWTWMSLNLRNETRLVLENVYEHGPEQVLSLLETLEPFNTGFCFDVGHQHSMSRTSAEDWLDVLGRFLVQIHVHDNDGTSDQHLPLGRGNIDYGKLFSSLGRFSEPVVTVEIAPGEGLDKSVEFIENIWPWR